MINPLLKATIKAPRQKLVSFLYNEALAVQNIKLKRLWQLKNIKFQEPGNKLINVTVRLCSNFILSEQGIESRLFILQLNGLIILWLKVLNSGKCVTAMLSWSFVSSLESFSLPTRSLVRTFTKSWLKKPNKNQKIQPTTKNASPYTVRCCM